MRMEIRQWGAGAIGACVAAAGAAAQGTEAATGVVEALQKGRPILDLRLRAADIEQTGFAEDAFALTLRTRLGWETAALHGFTALAEFEDVRAIVEDYNSTTNGETAFPVEADPDVTELNRAQIKWTGANGLAVTGGRQRLVFDDHRFVGNVGWRQDEQTLDAARIDFAKGRFAVSYAYVWGVERVFAEAADWSSSSHLVNARYAFGDALALSGFVYALDFDEAPAMSTATIGAAASGAASFSAVRLTYGAVLATQSDYGDNPGDVDLGYGRADLGLRYGPVTAGARYEVLEGDGVRGFATPLATLHAFQGWADVFLATPAAGIEDLELSARFAPMWSAGALSAPNLLLAWHEFEAERTGADLGSELDVQFTVRLAERVSGLVKLADYDGPAGGPADRTKLWFGLELSL